MKRIFDVFLSSLGLLILSPLFLLIAIMITIKSRGGIFYKQKRVGKNNKDFYLFKFRTMIKDADKSSDLTVGKQDSRITKSGYLLRKYKLDELPQLFNVLLGNMSLVGPRPEVRKYVNLYTPEQREVLSVKPGITDYASIEYAKESELLGNAIKPEETYITQIMPAKLKLNSKYIIEQNLFTDMKIIFNTFRRIINN
ncbi:MAG: sugar transferase [Bacteroidota bacterium]